MTVYGPHCIRCWRAHSWFPWDRDEPCDCNGHHCAGAQSTIAHEEAAAATAKCQRIPLTIVVPPTTTPSGVYVYNWHCWMWKVCCHHGLGYEWWVGGYLGMVSGVWKELVLRKGGEVNRLGDRVGMLGNGGGIIRYDKEVGWGVALSDDVAWLWW